MDQLVLPGFPKAAHLDEMHLRADYEALLDRCARLLAYAQSTPRHIPWPVVDRQDRLAEDDLVVFALRARRFIDAASLRELAFNVVVPIGAKRNEYRSIWRVITTLIHYSDLFLVRSLQTVETVWLCLRGAVKMEDFVIDDDKKTISALVWLSSDHESSLIFDLATFLQIFCRRLLHPAIITCREHGVELTSVEQDFDLIAEQLPKIQGNDLIARWTAGQS